MANTEKFYSAKNKLANYNQESDKLVLGALNFEDAYNENFSLPEIVYLLRESFKKRITHQRVLGEDMRTDIDPSDGFCMISSYLIYSMTGGDAVWELRGTNMHWWLYHKKSHTIFDVTHTQFKPGQLPEIYSLGQPVNKLKTDDMFYDVLKQKAVTLAKYAGLE